MSHSRLNREGWSVDAEKSTNSDQQASRRPKNPNPCPQLPGTLLRIYIPAGATVNILNIIELTTPDGICFIIRLPILSGELDLFSVVETIKKAGGTVEVVEEQ